MSKKAAKKKRMQNELSKLKVQKRNGIVKLVCGIAFVLIVIIARITLTGQGILEWHDTALNIIVYACAFIACVIVGRGTMDWTSANRRIKEIESTLNRKKK